MDIEMHSIYEKNPNSCNIIKMDNQEKNKNKQQIPY